MVPEEWPIAPPPVNGAASPARRTGRGRLPVIRQDFFLDPAKRLSEQERALMTAMLADLAGGIADELRARVGSGAAANDDDGHQLVAQLGRARLLDDAQLIALLLRRADEERIASAMRVRTPNHPAFLQALVADSDGLVSSSAMAVILARGGRRDRLGQPRIQFDDLPEAAAQQLTYAIAGALRASAAGTSRDDVDERLSMASEAVMARRDPLRAIAGLTERLAGALLDAGKLDDGLLIAAVEEGDVGFLAAALARRAGIAEEDAWDHLVEGGDGRLMLLLRMAGAGRQLAAVILGLLGDLIGLDDEGREIARFDSLDDETVKRQRIALNLHPAYQHALRALGTDGQRSV